MDVKISSRDIFSSLGDSVSTLRRMFHGQVDENCAELGVLKALENLDNALDTYFKDIEDGFAPIDVSLPI